MYLWSQTVVPDWFANGIPHGSWLGKIVRGLLLTGTYPLVAWAAPLLIGLWVGRRDLTATPVRWKLLVLELVVALAAALVADQLTASCSWPIGCRGLRGRWQLRDSWRSPST